MVDITKEEINDGFIYRIELLMKYKSLTQRSLANEIGFSYSTLNKYCNKKSNTIDYELVYRISSQFSDINIKWLVEGVGQMLSEDLNGESKHLERMDRLVDTIATLQRTINEKDKTIQLLEGKTKHIEAELAMIKNERKIG